MRPLWQVHCAHSHGGGQVADVEDVEPAYTWLALARAARGSVPQTDQDVVPDDDVTLRSDCGRPTDAAVVDIDDQGRVLRVRDVEDAEAGVMALEGMLTPEGEIRVEITSAFVVDQAGRLPAGSGRGQVSCCWRTWQGHFRDWLRSTFAAVRGTFASLVPRPGAASLGSTGYRTWR